MTDDEAQSRPADVRLTKLIETCTRRPPPVMTSLVAPKPSDVPTSPGLISYGSDPAALDDYLNLDLFNTRAGHSPASSHGALPVTPSTSENPTMDESMPFDGFNPLDKTLGAFDMGFLGGDMDQYTGLFQEMFPTFSEPASGPSAPVIDPQLFTAPPPVPAPSVPEVVSAPTPIESESEDDELDEVAPLPRTRKPKKNAAAAGGIAKRPSRASTPASVVPSYVHFDDPKPVIPPALGKGGVASYLSGERIGSQEPDEWRPTPEEYKKLSSKEKRQLRNKISARNFRVRRKEYITTLESHIADRDQLIAAIRSELSTTHNENTELRREIDALKRAIQEGRLSAEATGLPPPRPLTPEQSASPATPSTPAPRRPTDLARANTQKDRSSDASGRSFWGGAVGHGGVTSVHTTLIPEVFPQPISAKPRNVSPSSSGSSSASPSTPPNEGVNMNPLMNLSPLFASKPATPAVNVGLDIMDQAFNQRTLEGFRAQLWGRMAKEAGARSVLAERRMEGVEQSPLFSPALGSASPVDSSSQPISSSPSLSMLNQPATLRSLFENASGRLFDAPSSSMLSSPALFPSSPALFPSSTLTPATPASNTPAPALQASSTPAPALLQASSFGAGFLGSSSASTGFAASAASMQARAMLQAQWLALQQSRQQTAQSTSTSTSSTLPFTAQPTQREIYLAQFAQAAAAQQQLQQHAQQQQLGGLAAGVKPAYFASSREKDLVSAMSGLSLDKAGSGIDKNLSGMSTSGLDKITLGTDTKSTLKGTTPQQAAFAASLASQTLLQRMGSAFWDAFSTTGSSSRDVDTTKVRRVLEGKAVVRVVDLDLDEERIKGLGLERGVFGNLRGKK
ncbi:bZIP transcription factor [Rhizoctonia solani AG-3 Rhs1AP]|uniref:BZIP transcription factor n=1 Tax=Rhizoctonia solani AG-3 Rhs1AP TaxID=1086054 RepID=X8J0H3_9AGAM|nr:bZIP transcription factor [Rhizoctonia solani AG-3 Rhs1AP]